MVLAAPEFRTKDLVEVMEEGESRRISLKYTGIPEPEVEWKLNGSLARGVQIDSSNNTTSMYLKNADRAKHAGTYTVSLKNAAGSTTCNVKVQITGTAINKHNNITYRQLFQSYPHTHTHT